MLFHIQDTNRRQAINWFILGLSCFPPLDLVGPVVTLFTCLLVRQIRVQIALGCVHIRFAVLSQKKNQDSIACLTKWTHKKVTAAGLAQEVHVVLEQDVSISFLYLHLL